VQRRLFLKRMSAIAGTAAIPVTAATTAIQNNARVQESSESLKKRLGEAEKRIEKLQKDHKKVIKSGLVITGVLVGLDLSLLL